MKIRAVAVLGALILSAEVARGQDEAEVRALSLREAPIARRTDPASEGGLRLSSWNPHESPSGRRKAAEALDQERGQQEDRPWLADRGEGVTSTLFATYIPKGEWLVYTYYEHDRNKDQEYKPKELGFGLDQDFF